MKLFYFTLSYPFGIGEQWKANELNVLVDHFDEITVVPFSYANNYDNPKPLPKGVKLAGPLFRNEQISKSDLLKIFFHRKSGMFIREMLGKKVFGNRQRLVSWLLGTKRAINLLKHPVIKQIVNGADKDTVLYFYWGRGSSEMLPFIDTGRFHKSFVRMHGFDLFEYRNNNYIPYRKQLLKAASIIAPSSKAGKDHLDSLYPAYANKVQVVRCGTVSAGQKTPASSTGTLRVASCAFLTGLKRIHLQIEAVANADFPIEWYHIGDGELMEELVTLTKKLKVADKFHFVGRLDSRQVLDYYGNNPFDLFVNVSEYEGVPFSIMEAYSVGIPVLATDVGGTGEIVNNSLGRLIGKELTGPQLAGYLKEFYQMDENARQAMRTRVMNEYESKWNAVNLTRQLAADLKAS